MYSYGFKGEEISFTSLICFNGVSHVTPPFGRWFHLNVALLDEFPLDAGLASHIYTLIDIDVISE